MRQLLVLFFEDAAFALRAAPEAQTGGQRTGPQMELPLQISPGGTKAFPEKDALSERRR